MWKAPTTLKLSGCAPREPLKTRICNGSPSRSDRSGRYRCGVGLPVTSTLDELKQAKLSLKPTQIFLANRHSIRLARPGKVFCSIRTSGVRLRIAAAPIEADA